MIGEPNRCMDPLGILVVTGIVKKANEYVNNTLKKDVVIKAKFCYNLAIKKFKLVSQILKS